MCDCLCVRYVSECVCECVFVFVHVYVNVCLHVSARVCDSLCLCVWLYCLFDVYLFKYVRLCLFVFGFTFICVGV